VLTANARPRDQLALRVFDLEEMPQPRMLEAGSAV